MEKAPEPSHARIGEELPSARWEYTILTLRKILIYANVSSHTASFGMRPCAGPGLLPPTYRAGRDRYPAVISGPVRAFSAAMLSTAAADFFVLSPRLSSGLTRCLTRLAANPLGQE
jgi:hypothetical protein